MPIPPADKPPPSSRKATAPDPPRAQARPYRVPQAAAVHQAGQRPRTVVHDPGRGSTVPCVTCARAPLMPCPSTVVQARLGPGPAPSRTAARSPTTPTSVRGGGPGPPSGAHPARAESRAACPADGRPARPHPGGVHPGPKARPQAPAPADRCRWSSAGTVRSATHTPASRRRPARAPGAHRSVHAARPAPAAVAEDPAPCPQPARPLGTGGGPRPPERRRSTHITHNPSRAASPATNTAVPLWKQARPSRDSDPDQPTPIRSEPRGDVPRQEGNPSSPGLHPKTRIARSTGLEGPPGSHDPGQTSKPTRLPAFCGPPSSSLRYRRCACST